MSTEIETLNELKKVSRADDLKQIQEVVSKNIPHLTAAALASALGGTVVLKMTQTEQGKMKYVPCATTEEIIQALDWISKYGNSLDEPDGFYIIQQRPPDAKFWEYLTHRHLGKVPDSEKEAASDKLDLAEIGRKAIQMTHPNNIEAKTAENAILGEMQGLIPSSWR